MPLSEKTRIEVYIPDKPKRDTRSSCGNLIEEFTLSFGGCSIHRGVEGRYRSKHGRRVRDRVNLIYTDTPFSFDDNLEKLSRYTEHIRDAILSALHEEAVLVTAFKVFDAE